MRRAKEDPDPLLERIERIRRRGYELISDETLRGITDISFPILDGDGVAQAVMTMPFLVWVANKVEIEEAEQRLFDGAQAVSQEIGGSLELPQFPLVRGPG
jgi:DNA-binding IclR family transcriptional regulator